MLATTPSVTGCVNPVTAIDGIASTIPVTATLVVPSTPSQVAFTVISLLVSSAPTVNVAVVVPNVSSSVAEVVPVVGEIVVPVA